VPIADAVVDAGYVPERTSYEALAAVLGMPLVALNQTAPALFAVRMVPAPVARRHRLVPLAATDSTLKYATCRPLDEEAERDVAFTSGRRPEAVLATRTDIDELLLRSYPRSSELEALLARLRSTSIIELLTPEPALPPDPVVVDLCLQLIARAVEAGSSDIRVESTHAGAVVRFRVAGIMEAVATIPPASAPAVCDRFKAMARTDLSSRMRAQDGGFAVRLDGRRVDVRLSSVPTVSGEKLTMRVIDSGAPFRSLDEIGYPADVHARLRQALSKTGGLVVITGPTSSGRTTSLYASLDALCSRSLEILSVEDPIERQLPGVTQVPVNNHAGSTYASVLRSAMREPVDVVVAADMSDAETAGILAQAAYAGRLVLGSLCATDSVTAIVQLLHLGLEPFKVAESLSAVVAQRLVRQLCPHCRIVHATLEGQRPVDVSRTTRVGASPGPGCPACRFTGYTGRLVIAELLAPDTALRDAIARGGAVGELRAAMRAAGTLTMRDRGIQLVADGLTSMDEVNRVLAPDESPAGGTPEMGRVLVAEDDGVTRKLVKLLLERDGYTVLEAATGRQAVEIAVREHPALVVMDLNMPEMNGYDAISHLRRVPALSAMPVLVLTSEEGPDVERTVMRLGADDYVLKPFDPAILSSRIKAAFRRLRVAAA
jgi:type IV pilus assembly protein PilB